MTHTPKRLRDLTIEDIIEGFWYRWTDTPAEGESPWASCGPVEFKLYFKRHIRHGWRFMADDGPLYWDDLVYIAPESAGPPPAEIIGRTLDHGAKP